MSAKNPPGYPLTGKVVDTDDGAFVEYRPRMGGRRKRVWVPVEVADVLREAQSREVDRRQALADEPRKPRKRKASKRKASKRSTRRSPARKVAEVAERASDVAAEVAKPGQLGLFNPDGNPRGAPNLARLGTVAELGRVVELRVEADDGRTYAHRWRSGRPRLLWSPTQRCLVWVMGASLDNRQKGAVRSDGAARVFESWAQRDAVQTATISVPAAKLKKLGRAVSIIYTSDKWGARGGRTTQYIHEFSQSVKAYGGGSVFAVRGGRLTVTERGIVY